MTDPKPITAPRSTRQKKRSRKEISDPTPDTTPVTTKKPKILKTPRQGNKEVALGQSSPIHVDKPNAKKTVSGTNAVETIPPPPFSITAKEEESKPPPMPTRKRQPALDLPAASKTPEQTPLIAHQEIPTVETAAAPPKPTHNLTYVGILASTVLILTLLLAFVTGLWVTERMDYELKLYNSRQIIVNYAALDDKKARDGFYLKELEDQVRYWKLDAKGARVHLETCQNQLMEQE